MDELPVPRDFQSEPLQNKQAALIFVIAVIFLGLVATICSGGAVYLSFNDKPVPDSLLQTCGVALTLLGALFVARGGK